jgi:hypothetical protein
MKAIFEELAITGNCTPDLLDLDEHRRLVTKPKQRKIDPPARDRELGHDLLGIGRVPSQRIDDRHDHPVADRRLVDIGTALKTLAYLLDQYLHLPVVRYCNRDDS